MTRGRAVALGSLCALVGGLCWVVKGSWILVTGWQPPVIYEVAPLFFPVTSGALFVLPRVRCRRAIVGLVVASIAELAAVLSVLGLFLGPPEWQPTGSTVTLLTPWITLAALGAFGCLVLLGVPVRRARALPGWSRNLPLLIGAGAIPVLAVGGLLEMVRTHLIEVATVAMAWAGSLSGWRCTALFLPNSPPPILHPSDRARELALTGIRGTARGCPRGTRQAAE